MSLEQIHPVLITRDAAATVGRSLASLAAFPEVLLYDNGSTDDTLAIAARFPNVRIVTGTFFGFGKTKNHAASLASGDWILSIDADEIVGADLLAALRAADLTDERAAYSVCRHNLFMGREIRRGGWGQDWLTRLFNRRCSHFNDAAVHEKLVPADPTAVRRLDGALWHLAVIDIDQFLQKVSRYSELRRRDGGRALSPAAIAWRAAWAFFKSYVLQLGVLEGWRGLMIARCNALGTFFRHMKRFVDQAVPAADRLATPAEPPPRSVARAEVARAELARRAGRTSSPVARPRRQQSVPRR